MANPFSNLDGISEEELRKMSPEQLATLKKYFEAKMVSDRTGVPVEEVLRGAITEPAPGVQSFPGEGSMTGPQKSNIASKGGMVAGDRVDPSFWNTIRSAAPFEMGDEMTAFGEAARGSVGLGKTAGVNDFWDRYEQSLAGQDAVRARTRKDHPILEPVASLGAMMPAAMATGGLGAASYGGAAAAGAGIGSLIGFGEGRGAEESLGNMPLGGLFGAAGGAAGKGIGDFLFGKTGGIMKESIEDFAKVGSHPSVSQATKGGTVSSGIEKALLHFFPSSGPIKRFAATQRDQLKKALPKGGAIEDAGETLIKGAQKKADDINIKGGTLYDKIQIPGATRPDDTLAAFGKLLTPAEGGKHLGRSIEDSTLRGWFESIQKDLGESGGQMGYDAMNALRRKVGKMMTNPFMRKDMDEGALSLLHGAITGDMKRLAGRAGPQHLHAFNRANNYWRSGIKRIDEVLKPATKGKSAEKAIESLGRGTLGVKKLWALRRSLPKEEWDEVVATVANRMGRARAGQQDATGHKFSSETFLTRWIDDLTPGQKSAMFPKEIRDPMEKLAQAAQHVRSGNKQYANPSGTTGTTVGAAVILNLISDLVGGSFGAVGLGAATSFAANMSARVVTNKNFVKFMAEALDVGDKTITPNLSKIMALGPEVLNAQDPVQALITKLTGKDEEKDQDRLELDISLPAGGY